jgi:formylglycine-generating enzyme required for sulfatase activity
MNGNVSEWVEDCVNNNCGMHELRGGSWFANPREVMSAYPDNERIDAHDIAEGFRVARVLP